MSRLTDRDISVPELMDFGHMIGLDDVHINAGWRPADMDNNLKVQVRRNGDVRVTTSFDLPRHMVDVALELMRDEARMPGTLWRLMKDMAYHGDR